MLGGGGGGRKRWRGRVFLTLLGLAEVHEFHKDGEWGTGGYR